MGLPVTFSFDPLCPWTWRTSRWLVLVAPERDLDVEWRSFSLLLLQGDGVPDQYRAPLETARDCLRLVEALQVEGRNADAGRLYAEVGVRVHDEGRTLTRELLVEAAESAGLTDRLDALDDAPLDEAVRRSHDAAWAAAGPDIGSPVLQVGGAERGLHGPILGEVPPLEQSLSIWDSVQSLVGCHAFFEVKRGRP